jgi:hypothetical protein
MGRSPNIIEFTKEWINNYPKTINENGCWIPNKIPSSNGYVTMMSNGREYSIHRVALCIYYGINYDNPKIDTRHNNGCDHACFFYGHLQPGTASDNVKDQVRDGVHRNSKKENCPKCGSKYSIKMSKTGWTKGQISRYCNSCRIIKRRERIGEKKGNLQ